MKIAKSVPDFTVEIPNRITIGKEYWANQGTSWNIDESQNSLYTDIDAQSRLQKEERSLVFGEKQIKVGEEEMDKIIASLISKFITPENIGKLMETGVAFIIKVIKMVIDRGVEAAAKTETKVDDMFIDAVDKAFDKLTEGK